MALGGVPLAEKLRVESSLVTEVGNEISTSSCSLSSTCVDVEDYGCDEFAGLCKCYPQHVFFFGKHTQNPETEFLLVSKHQLSTISNSAN